MPHPLAICHQCPRRSPLADGPKLHCLETGRPIIEQSDAGVCPLGRFDAPPPRPPIPLAGDLLAAAIERFGGDRVAAWWTRLTGRPCGCARRRERINRVHRWLRRPRITGRNGE